MSEPVPGCSKPSAAMSRRSPGPAAGRWKLIFDPQLRNDHPHRVYRIGGRVANDAQGIYSAYNWDEDAKDPRIAVEDIFPVPFDLKVPVLKIDEYYPNPPEREISFFNLHPSISERQLAADCRKYGGISELKLYTHPKTHHQLGLARVIFKTVPAAKRCEMDRNEKPWHGRTVKCFYDMKGRVVRTAYELLVTGRMRSAAGASALIKAAIDAVIEQEKQRESLEAEERANAITKRGEGDFMNEEGYYPSVARTPSPSDMFGRLPRQKVAIPACAAEGHKMDRQAEPIVNAAELPLPPAPPPPSPPVVPVAPRAVDRPSTSSVNVSVNPLTEQNSPAPVDPCPIVLQKANAAAQNVAECSRAPENPRSRSRTDRRRSRSKKRKSKSRERSSSKRSKSKARGKSRSRKKSKSHRRRKYSDSGSSSSSDSSESRSRSRRKDRSKYDLPPASSKVDRKMAYSQKEYQKSRSPKKRSEKWTGNVDSHSERRHRRHKLVEEVKEERVKIVRTTKFEVSPLVDSSSGSVPSNVLSSPRVATGPRTPPSNSPQPPVKLPVNSPVPLKENEATLGECSGSTLSQRLNSLIAKNVPGYSLDNTAAVGTQAGSTPVDTSGSSKNAPEPVAATPPQFKPAHSSAVRQHGRGKPQDASGGQHGNYESYMAYWNQWNWAMQYHQMYPAMYAPPMPPTAVMGMAAPPPPHGMPFWAPGVPPPPVPPYVHNAAAGPAPPRAAAVVDKAAARQHAQPQFGRPREKRWEVGVAARPAVRDPRDQRVRQPAESDHALGKENFGDKAVAGSSGIVERVKVLAAAMSRVRKDIEMATLRSLKQRACTRVAHDAFDSIYDDQEAKYREELAVKAAATCKSLEEASPHKSASTQEADSTEVASTSKKPAENVADGATTGVSSTLAQLFGAGVSTSLHGMPGFGLRQALPKIRKKRVSSPVQQATKREDASPSSRPLSAHAPARPGSQLRALSVDRDSGSECDNDNVGDASRRRGARVLVDEDSEAEKKDTGGKLTGIDDIGKDAASSTADSDAATSQEEDSDAEATEADDNAAYNGLDASQVQSAASSDSGDSSDSDEVEQSDSENESGEETAVDGGSDAAENEKRDDAKMKESSKTTPGPAFNGSLATKSVDVLLGKIKENERESIPESHEPGPSMCVSEMERYEAWVHDHDYAFVAPGGSDAGGQQKDDWRARLALTLYSTAIHESVCGEGSSKRKADRESLQSPPKKRPKKKASPVTVNKEFKPRSDDEQKRIVFGFTKNNFLDSEDMKYLERSFVALRSEFGASPTHWSLQAHWAPHAMPPLELNDAALGSGDAGMKSPGGRSRKSAAGKHGGSDILPPVHRTGCARSEGYYKLSAELKASLTRRADTSFARTELQSAQDVLTAKQQAQREKEARLLQRRLATAIGCEDIEDNNLKFRRKLLRFGRSRIHGWGLFALEDIVPDSMVIEYVGETLRSTVADARELRYMRQGMGSSYLFRIDDDTVIDATKKGAVARFINHSCNPSCYAKIITAGGSKRIVIYSRKHISKGEEITYDYKFPIEDDKIPCLCGAPGCRRWLN